MFEPTRSLRARLARLLKTLRSSGPDPAAISASRGWRRFRRRALPAVPGLPALAVLGGALFALAAQGRAPWPRVTGWLLADRGAGQLLELDAGLNVIGWQSAPHPLRVVTRAPGSAGSPGKEGPDGWWVEGLPGAPLGPHRLHALGLPLPAAGEPPLTEPQVASPAGGEWPYVRDLVVDAEGAAFLLSGALSSSAAELWRVRLGEAPERLATLEGAQHLALDAAGLGCGGADGRHWRVDFGGDVLHEARVGAEVHALALHRGDLWSLDASGVLRRLSAEFELDWSVDLGFAPGPLAVDRDGLAWIAAEGQPLVQPVDPLGRLLTPVTDVGGDSWTDLDARAPKLLGAAPGYVLQLDGFGGALASQGGFDYLADLAPTFGQP